MNATIISNGAAQDLGKYLHGSFFSSSVDTLIKTIKKSFHCMAWINKKLDP